MAVLSACPGPGRRTLTTLSVSLLSALAALPTTSAPAAIRTTAASSQAGVGLSSSLLEIPGSGFGALIGTLPVSDLGLTNAELTVLLGGLEGGALSGLDSTVTPIVASLLSGNPTATLEELTGALQANGVLATVLSLAGVTLTPEGVLEALSPAQLATFLANTTAGLTAQQLAELLSGLAGNLSPEQLASLQTILGPLVQALPEASLNELRSGLHALPGGLGEGELALLDPAQLATLLGEAFKSASPAQLAPLLGDVLGGLTWGSGTAGSLAQSLGVPLETLAGNLGESLGGAFGQLPAMTSDLGGGQIAGVLPKAGGLAFGLLKPVTEGVGGEEGAGGGTGGSGGGTGGSGGVSGGGTGGAPGGSGSGTGGAGGVGGSGAPAGGTTILLSLPATQPGAPVASARRAAKRPALRVQIVSRRVQGGVATLVLQVPAPGRVSVAGRGVHSRSARVARAGRATIRLVLTTAARASLHKHRNRLRVRLRVLFRAAAGGGSSAATVVTFA
jgi:hypothetical protein